MENMSSVPTLGYWDIRGLAEPIRYLLKYVGISFIDKRYQFGHGNSFSEWENIKEPWLRDRQRLGLDFPNIPYYIEGDLKLSQSLTILRYLAKRHGLMATDEQTLAQQEMVEQQIQEMLYGLAYFLFNEDYEQKKSNYMNETLIPQLELLAKFLGSKEWLTSKFSYVDILTYENLDKFRLFTPETFEKFPTLEQYLTRFENLKLIKEYQNSPEYKSWPLFGPMLKWGGAK